MMGNNNNNLIHYRCCDKFLILILYPISGIISSIFFLSSISNVKLIFELINYIYLLILISNQVIITNKQVIFKIFQIQFMISYDIVVQYIGKIGTISIHKIILLPITSINYNWNQNLNIYQRNYLQVDLLSKITKY